MQKKLITVNELSEMIGIKVNTLYIWVSQKRIPYVKVGRLTKFDLQAIDGWIKENTVDARDFS